MYASIGSGWRRPVTLGAAGAGAADLAGAAGAGVRTPVVQIVNAFDGKVALPADAAFGPGRPDSVHTVNALERCVVSAAGAAAVQMEKAFDGCVTSFVSAGHSIGPSGSVQMEKAFEGRIPC
jgi:hypothetical protein